MHQHAQLIPHLWNLESTKCQIFHKTYKDILTSWKWIVKFVSVCICWRSQMLQRFLVMHFWNSITLETWTNRMDSSVTDIGNSNWNAQSYDWNDFYMHESSRDTLKPYSKHTISLLLNLWFQNDNVIFRE